MKWLCGVGLFVWGAAVALGLNQLWAYENTPGAATVAPAEWPEASRLPRPTDRAPPVLLIHPECRCSRATVAELARLHARVGEVIDTYVLAHSPAGADDEWMRSPVWQRAAAIDGVIVIADEDGAEARRFGASTPGQTLLYDRGGRLRFNGSITGSRGHEGSS